MFLVANLAVQATFNSLVNSNKAVLLDSCTWCLGNRSGNQH